MRKNVVYLVLLSILAFTLGMLACSDNNDDLMETTQSFTVDDGDLTLEISDLKVDPVEKSSWTERETNFLVTARVRNVGIMSGTYSAVLLQVFEERETTYTEEVFLESGAEETVNFLVVKESPGTYQLELGELRNEFKIETKGYILNIIIVSIFAIAVLLWMARYFVPAREGFF